MGESSACLLPSFSQLSPTSSEKKKENNPIQRALTTSVSFGRFMSESLDWEKWSAFTHNRYLEEVEKYSKPGSVAEKKAYFEAHFKRRRAAALLEQQNEAANDVSEMHAVKDNFSSNLDLDLRDGYAVIENTKDEEVQNNGPVFLVDQNNSYDASIKNQKVTELPVVMESPVELTTKHLENDEHIKDIVSKKEDKACNEDDDCNKRNSASLSEKKSEASSSKLSTNGSASKCAPLIMPSQIRNSVKTRDSKKIAVESSNKRRSYTTSLHMSINFASSSEKVTSQVLPKIANSRLVRAPAKKYKNSMVPQNSTMTSVNGIFKHHSAAPPAENRRTVKPQGDSNLIRRTVDFKVQSQFLNYSKSSNTLDGKTRLPTTSSPFTFKSEERAAKRKEYFQKLEQKFKSKEAEKHELHGKSQVKAITDFKNLHISIATKNAEKVELYGNLKKKIPTVRPSCPKVEERASFKVDDSDSRPPWGLSAKREGLKDVTGKNRHPSGKCFPKKSNENASPNIRL